MAEEAQGVVWTYAARADLLEALEYLSNRSPTAAESFLADVEAAAASLTRFPQRGALVNELGVPNLRQLIVKRYRLVYRVDEGELRLRG